MTYEQWVAEMNKGRGTELQEKKRLIEEAAAKCSKKTREALKPFLEDLDDLFAGPAGDIVDVRDMYFEQEDREPVSKDDFELKSLSFSNGLVTLMSSYETPLELISQKGVANALGYIFDALGVLDKKCTVPRFERDDERDAAVRNDPDTVAAQALAMKDMKGEVPLREFLVASVSMLRWKQDPAFKQVMKMKELQLRLIQDEDYEFFNRDIQYYINDYEKKNAKTFKELSDGLAKDYRLGKIKYAQLEASMNALRAAAKTKTGDPKDFDNVRITTSELREQIAKLRKAAPREKTPEEYQAELADSQVMPQDHITERVHDVYDAIPVFQKDFDNPDSKDSSYRKQDFDRFLKPVDIREARIGSDPLSNDEFGSLSFLAVIDPEIAGSSLSIGGKSVKIENGDMSIAVSMLLHCTIAFGDATKEVDGKTVYGPEMRVGSAMEQCVAPARKKAIEAVNAWKRGNAKPLAELIAEGVNAVVNDIRHIENRDGTLNQHLAVYSNMVKGAVDLLKRSDVLMDAARDAGLKDETVQEMEGMIMANRIEKAGLEARRRLLESSQGLLVLSSFEKEQCVLAVQRYDTMMDDIKRATKVWDQSKEYEDLSIKAANIPAELKLADKYGPNYRKDPKAMEEFSRLQYRYFHEQTKLLKRPGVFRTLGALGAAGLDAMIPKNSLDWEKAAAMSTVELAQKLGLTKKREINTTAQQVYDQLTKAYKANQLKYDQYAARLRTMRELTGDNKDAKIDIKAIDDAIEAKLNRSLGPVEEEIRKLTKNEYGGVLGRRIDTVYKT